MSTIVEQIREERKLAGAPRVTALAAGYAEAAALAERYARAQLSLPAFAVVWCAKAGGNEGETWWWPDGRVEVCINAGADPSPRDVARVVLHECRHVADGERFCAQWPQQTEKSAIDFSSFVMRELAPRDFDQLSGRRPSGRR
jgi:hypothetical protein